MIRIQRSHERGATQLGWLDSKHSFSFGDWFDEERVAFGSLRVLNDDKIAPGAGFPRHPHADMEIVTYVLSGAVEHKDSTGGHGVIRAGEVQHMTAGRGVAHSEFNASAKEPLHLLQIWFLPDEAGLEPGYEEAKVDLAAAKNALTPVVAKEPGAAPLAIHQDARMLVGELDAGKSVTHRLGAGRGAFVFVVSGALAVLGETLGAGDAAEVVDVASLELVAKEGTHVVVFDVALEPIVARRRR